MQAGSAETPRVAILRAFWNSGDWPSVTLQPSRLPLRDSYFGNEYGVRRRES